MEQGAKGKDTMKKRKQVKLENGEDWRRHNKKKTMGQTCEEGGEKGKERE